MPTQTIRWTMTALTLLASSSLAASPAFTSTQHGFSLSAPDGWEKVDKLEGAIVAFVAPSPAGQFRPNVNVVVEPLPYKVALSTYTRLSLENISKAESFKNYKLISQRSRTVDGKPATEVTWSARTSDSDLQFTQIYIVKPDKAFVLTFTDTQKHFATGLPGGRAVMNTFKYK